MTSGNLQTPSASAHPVISKNSPESCPNCDASVTEGAQYCSACGAPVEADAGVACPACKELNPRRARFCLACGAPMASVVESDRRVVTVLFADLSGFTSMTEGADPEEVHRLVAGCLDRLSRCITNWDGYVDKFIGDCVMGIFGAPVAYENEEERAVRAALEMHTALEEWSRELGDQAEGGYKPQLRIGINTGPVVMGFFGAGSARDYTAVGDTVNVASRLEGLCDTGRILVGPATYENARHLFDFEDAQVLQLKGRQQSVEARHVIGARAERARRRGFEGKRIGLVGRTEELAELGERWSRAKAGSFQLCVVVGPAGIGKSRLVEELIEAERIPDEDVAIGRSYPYSSSTPWDPVAQLVRDLYDLPPDRSAAEAIERLVCSRSDAWPTEQCAGLKVALGSPMSEVPELQAYGAAERHGHITAGVTRALRAAKESPQLLILEDLHWADRTTLEFLCGLPDADLEAPVLLLLVTRPPLPGENFLARMMEAVSDHIELVPLPTEEVQALIGALLEKHDLPDKFLADIVERAAGNPLFIEETLKTLVEGSTLEREDGVWQAVGDISDLPTPDTIESLLTTRIDGLEGSTKNVLQYAAIVGRRFWSGVLTDALARRPIDRELDFLLEGAFVHALPHSSVGGEREFMFEHLLLQEVAYEGMLRGLRAELHTAVAKWLESRLGVETTQYDDWIAFHYEHSNSPESALPYLERAAADAQARGALLDARSLMERALELATDYKDKARLLALAEDISSEAGDMEARRAAIKQLESLAEETNDEWTGALAGYLGARFMFDSGDLSTALTMGESALERFEKLGDISRQGDALRLVGRVCHLWGDYPAALRFYRASLPLEREAGDLQGQAEIFDQLGLVKVDIGDYSAGLDHFEAAREMFAELGNQPGQARVAGHQAMALRWLGRYDEAEAAARTALEMARDSGSQLAEAGTQLTLAETLAAKGDIEGAKALLRPLVQVASERDTPGLEARAWLALAHVQTGSEARDSVERALALAARTGLVHAEIFSRAREAELELEAGNAEAADQASAAALERLDEHGNIEGPEESVLYTRARVHLWLGRAKEAEECLERARTIVRRCADRLESDEDRRQFLEAIPLNRQILGSEGES